MSLNQALSDLFASLAAMMELRGENVFKVIAFQKVSRIIRESNIDFKKCMEEGVGAEDLIAGVRKIPGVVRAEVAGSLRRRRETIADVDIVGTVKEMSAADAIMAAFVKLTGIVQTIVTGPSKTSVRIANGM